MKIRQIFTRNTTLSLFMIWLVLVLSSFYIFNYVDSTQGINDFLEQLAKSLLQTAIIVFVGAVLNIVINRMHQQKEKEGKWGQVLQCALTSDPGTKRVRE